MLKAGEQRLERQEFAASRRQLDGQWQTLQPDTDLRDDRCVVFSQRKARFDCFYVLHKEFHRRYLRQDLTGG